VRFLIDQMFGTLVAIRLTEAGHDGLHVAEVGLSSASDDEVLSRAVSDDRVLVTENGPDFIRLLDELSMAGLRLTPVVIALKRSLPGGAAMNHALAEQLVRWAKEHPAPYRHVHWLPRYR